MFLPSLGGRRHGPPPGLPRGAPAILLAAAGLVATGTVQAHNPVFTPGPHVTYRGGLEVTLGYERKRERARGAGSEKRGEERFLELEYGLTSDWAVEMELPYASRETDAGSSEGVGDVVLRTRYRFLRLDRPGTQISAAVLAQVKLPTADDDSEPPLGSGSPDLVGGLLLGREGRRWYGYGAARYRLNSRGAGGLDRGDRQLLDLVGGVRPFRSGYLEADTVLFLELNWEHGERDERNGVGLAGTGGWELFVSPGFFWTYRNLAVRGGVQIPVARDLDGREPGSQYRLKLEFRYQL